MERYSSSFHDGNHYKPKLINKYEEIWILPSTFDISVKEVLNFLNLLNHKKVNIFAQEYKSYHDLQKIYKGKNIS